LLLFALPALAEPFATAQIPDVRATQCDYEDTTTGEAARVPVVVDLVRGEAANGHRVCKFDISHWLPGSAHNARMRAIDTATGLNPSPWFAATLDRPASATVTLALVGAASPTPPDPPVMASPVIASYNTASSNGSDTLSITLTNTPPAGGVIVVFLGAYIDAGGLGEIGIYTTGGTGLTITEHVDPTEVEGFTTGMWVIEYSTPPTALAIRKVTPTGDLIYGHGVAVNVTGQHATYLDVASATLSTGTSTTPTATTLPDLTDATSLVIGMMNRDGGNIVGGPGTDWNQLYEADEDNDPSYISVIYRTPESTGAYDPTWTLASSAPWFAVGIAIKGTAGGGGATYNESVSETSTASDSSSTTATRSGALAEAGSATDTNAATMVRAGALSEAGSAADAPVGVVVVARSVTEAGSASDAITGLVTASRAVTESASAADSQAAIMTRAGAVTEAASAADAESAALLAVAAVSEAASAGDTVTTGAAAYEVTISEAASAADAVSTIATRVASMSEALSAADAFTVTAVFGAAQSETASASDATNWSGALYSTDIAETATLEDAVSSALQALAAIAEAGDAADAPTVIISAGVSVLEPASAADALSTALQITALLSEPASAADTVLVQPDGTIDVGIEEAATALDEYVAVLIDGFLVITAPPRRTLTFGASRPANLSAAYRPRNLPGRGR